MNVYIKLQDGTVQNFFLTALGLLFYNIEEVGYERNHPLWQPIRRRPLEKQTTENRALIETYEKQIDFTDFGALESIIREIQRETK